MRPRNLLIILAATILAVFIVLNLADSLLIDLMWFDALGFGEVFTTTLVARTGVFGGAWLITFIAAGASGLIAFGRSRDRERLRVVRRTEEVTEINLPELIRALGDRVPWKALILGIAALLGLFIASSESASWDVYLKGLRGVRFGQSDPA